MTAMKTLLAKPINWLILAALAALVFAGLFWQNLLFASALLRSETRPALLRDAEWGAPASAFRERFKPGISETELLRWLAESDFKMEETGRARLTVQSLPCNETIEFSWETLNGVIRESSAVVSQDGCL